MGKFKKSDKDTLTLVYIHWFDASYQRGECTAEELNWRCELHSAGILVREDKEFVTIAIDRYDRDETWRYISHIPKVNIIGRQDVRMERSAKK